MTDLRHFIRVYDDAVAPVLCRRIIQLFEGAAHFHSGPRGRRVEERDTTRHFNWVQMNTADLADFTDIDSRLTQLLIKHVERYVGDTGYPFFRYGFEEFLIKRYRASEKDQFPPHVDVTNTSSMRRMLAVLIYLNDVPAGGETYFGYLDLSVQPKAGRLMMFPPTWLYPHAGLPPRTSEKYILGTYLTYTDPPTPPGSGG
jgi:2-oxoglutarate-Fe(II)-dependent oxygenase superfamily protein